MQDSMSEAMDVPAYTDTELKVKHLMTTDLFTLQEDDNLKTLDEVMGWRKIRHIPVVNYKKELVGLVTQRDFLNAAISQLAAVDEEEKTALYRSVQIKEVMRTNVSTVSPETSLKLAAKAMMDKKIGCLFVINESDLVGIITEADFVKAFYRF